MTIKHSTVEDENIQPMGLVKQTLKTVIATDTPNKNNDVYTINCSGTDVYFDGNVGIGISSQQGLYFHNSETYDTTYDVEWTTNDNN